MPLWPFHTWLPDAHTAAPTAGSVVLAGVLLKLGGYSMIRVLIPFFPNVFQNMAYIIATLGIISMIYGALVSLAPLRAMARLLSTAAEASPGNKATEAARPSMKYPMWLTEE